MKRFLKLSLYIGIPLLIILAVWAFNAMSGKDKLNDKMLSSENSQGKKGNNKANRGKVLPVSVYIVDYQEGENGLMRLGTLVANEKVDLASELSGRVIEVNFKEGQFIKKGQVLVKLNDDELLTQLTRAEFQLRLLEQRLERQKILLEKDAVSREDYDKVLTEYNVLKQDIEELKIRIGKMKIRAPFDGVIGFREVSNGAFLQPGSKIGGMVDLARLKLEFSIPEKYVTSRLVGTMANFTVEGTNRTFSAKIYAMDPQIDVNTRTILLRALYNNNDGLLRPGMSARVTMQTASGEKYLFVPNQAVVPDAKGRFVWLMKNGKAIPVQVQTGNRTTERLEIRSGIVAGDTIITTGMMQLKEGMNVIAVNQ